MKLSKIMLAGMFVCGSASVFAADTGTLTFNGSVIEDTCVITTSAGSDQTVTLAPAKTTEFTTIGTYASETKDFNIELTGCPAGNNYVISFPTDDNSSNRDNNYNQFIANQAASSPASGVALALFDQSGSTAIDLSSDSTAKSASQAGNDDLTAAITFPFTVKYVSTSDTVTAGNVTGKLKYQIAYE